jgi:hypothetical protein
MNIIKKQLHFKIGKQVWLHKQHIKTTWPFEKLDYKRLGPFIINKKINIVAFLFKFINSMKIHGLCFMYPYYHHPQYKQKFSYHLHQLESIVNKNMKWKKWSTLGLKLSITILHPLVKLWCEWTYMETN